MALHNEHNEWLPACMPVYNVATARCVLHDFLGLLGEHCIQKEFTKNMTLHNEWLPARMPVWNVATARCVLRDFLMVFVKILSKKEIA